MGNNDSYLEPDHTGRERFFKTTEDIDRINVVNEAIRNYNSGHIFGSTNTKYRDDECKYCDKLKEILGDKLQDCRADTIDDYEFPDVMPRYFINYDFKFGR
jgi:hypothetical protein